MISIENGYIVNDKGELRQKYVDAALHYGFNLPTRANKDVEWLDYTYIYTETSGEVDTTNYPPSGTELTLADFEPEEVIPTTKYKYTLVDKSPEEIYRAMLDGEVFYLDDCEMFWEDGSFWLDKDGGTRVTNIDNPDQICTRKEVKWQDEVSLLSGFKVVEDKITIDRWIGHEQFLEAARIALKSLGELK
ncbi:hypothetical protein NVP1161O_033 [Vibrio phage 1.161.O._10N.261.48.C5]|nr:hypothetical protein NVP1161O_033 [Vibrio phage 1.161.O._10N.261.48.C5]